MSKRISEPSFHSISRMKERTNYNLRDLRKKSVKASRYGKNPYMYEGAFGDYLQERARNKRVKVYDGYIWIFSKTSTRVITIYPIPEEFKQNTKQYLKHKKKTVH